MATAGLQPFIFKDITQNVSPENTLTIVEYVLAIKMEISISDLYRSTVIQNLSLIARYSKNQSFKHMTREDILSYLNSSRKSDTLDPLHKWIGTYNLRRTILIRFFKWLYYPNGDPKNRKAPAVV